MECVLFLIVLFFEVIGVSRKPDGTVAFLKHDLFNVLVKCVGRKCLLKRKE